MRLPARGLKIIATCFMCLTLNLVIFKGTKIRASLVPKAIVLDKPKKVSDLAESLGNVGVFPRQAKVTSVGKFGHKIFLKYV